MNPNDLQAPLRPTNNPVPVLQGAPVAPAVPNMTAAAPTLPLKRTPEEGAFVRRLFLAIGTIMILLIPLDRQLFWFNISVGIIGVLFITFLAGSTGRRSKSLIIVDALIAAVGFLLYEYLAVTLYYSTQHFFDLIFFARQAIAVLFVCAFYFSVKGLRILSRIQL